MYRDTSIQTSEVVKCTGELHWIAFWLPTLLGGSLAASVFPPLLAIGLGAFVAWFSWLRKESTKIIVTNQRITIKRGVVQRRIVQINMNQVESVDVAQSFLGMMFNCGTVIINCSGGRKEYLTIVAHPLRFQRQITMN
jgi:uncharacterized membrane protein YdbT with pleckstrin-like domain